MKLIPFFFLSLLLLAIPGCNLPGLDRFPLDFATFRLFTNLVEENTDFTLGGEARNLLGSGLRLDLQANNAATNETIQEDLVVSGTGTTQFAFQARLPENSTYTVTITQQPLNPTQICEVAGGSGTVTANVESILVQCGESLDVAQPVFSPPPGSFPSAVGVTITSSTVGASLFYTTDGSDPTCSGAGTAYAGPVNVPQPSLAGVEIRAIACFDGRSSNLQLGNYIVTNGQVGPPTSSLITNPPAANYTTAQNTTLSPGTNGTTVHYTTDGSTPTCSSTTYSTPINIAASLTLRAISCAPDWTPSVVTDFNYTIVGTVATPVPGKTPGTYNNDINLTLTTTTPGASIRYDIAVGMNPPTPTCGTGNLYTGPILIDRDDTRIRAIGCLAGWTDSAPTGPTPFTYNFQVLPPTLSPPSTTIQTSQTITGTTATTGATIHFTTDGTPPNCASSTTPPNLVAPSDGTETTIQVQAIACKANYTSSAPVSANYILTGVLNPPNISPATGTYTVAQTVTMSKDTNNPTAATIHYTTDGSTPTCASPTYTASFNATDSQNIQAIACNPTPEWTPSTVSSSNLTITGTVAPPTFSVAPGPPYDNVQTVTLTTPTPSSTVYWNTAQGVPTDPDCSGSNGSTGSITIDKDNTHVAAIACRAGWTDSGVVTGIYRLIAATPTPDIAPGGYGEGQTITFSSTTTGASFRINAGISPTTPTCADAVQNSITLPNGAGLNQVIAIACRADFQASTAFSGVYTIGSPMALPVVTVDALKFVTVGAISGTRCYTTNGVDPLCSGTNGGTPSTTGGFCAGGSTPYTAPFQLSPGVTDLRVRNCSTGNLQSPVAQQNITVNGTVGAVTITPAGGTVNNDPLISMSATNSTAIYYRTDGTNPVCTGTGSTLYSGPFTLTPTSPTMTINAIGCATDWIPSGIASQNYTFQVASPTISLAADTYNDVQTGITITTATTGAGITYTADGTDPACVAGGSTFAYTGPLNLPTDPAFIGQGGNFEIRTLACKNNYQPSPIPPTPVYTFQVAPLQILFGQSVFLDEATMNRTATTGPVSITITSTTPSSTFCRSTSAGITCNATGNCNTPATSTSGFTASEPGLLNVFKGCRAGFLPSSEKGINLTIPDRNTTPRIFVSAQTTPGNTSTIDADNLCNTDPNRPYQRPEASYQAMRLGGDRTLTSNWVLEPNTNYQSNIGAFLGQTGANASRFGTDPVTPAVGAVSLSNSIDLSLTTNTFVWTGMALDATATPDVFVIEPTINCAHWTSTSDPNGGRVGNALNTNNTFVAAGTGTCSDSNRLYCVERDYRKRIFVTANPQAIGTDFAGKQQADAVCNNPGEANKPSTGYYKALLRFSDRSWPSPDWVIKPNVTYYQTDRTTIIGTANANGTFDSFDNPISPTAGIQTWLGYQSSWTGSAFNCDDYTNPGGNSGGGANANQITLGSFFGFFAPCNFTTYRIICVEQ